MIRLLGVNAIGAASGNATITSGRDLPWLQDVDPPGAWDLWGCLNRDVVILDTAGVERARYNLSINDLGDAKYYQQLKAILKRAAGE